MGKEPCENCGLTNYNYVRKCQSKAKLKSLRGCGKFGCDHCFKPNAHIPNSHFCPDCWGTTEGSLFVLAIVLTTVGFGLAFAFGWFDNW